jgi:hypothetical protein
MARVKIGNVFPPVEYLLRHCAPAGYGLGDKGFNTYDLNNALNCGWYAFSDTAENTPFGYGIALVLNRFDVDIVQLAFSTTMFASIFSGAIARRMYTEDAWSEWEFINPPMEVGVEYRTTERWMGKPVYTSLVDCGSCVSPSKETTTELTCSQVIRHCGTVGGHNLPSINATLDNAWSAWAMVTNSDDRVKITVYSGTGMATERAYVQVWYTKS